ncbi:MAG TPA: MFS transporter [Syntrophales bacterium]|nr:MFS transporter [Syntrophales bacterium]HPI55800.1 MFS transporter [Syntrophales bacterium]HQM27766.1 MFS transporter [Syntrophales bacterium]
MSHLGSSSRSELSIPIFLASIFYFNFLSRIVLGPLMPSIEEDLGIRHAEAGSIFFSISFGYCVTLLGSGFLSKRLTHKQLIVASALAVGLSLTAVACSRTLEEMHLALLCLGLSAGLYLPSGMAALTHSVQAKNWGKAIAIHELAPNLGFITAPLIAEFMITSCTWRDVLSRIGLVSIVAGVIFAFFCKGGRFRGESPRFNHFRSILSGSHFWLMAALFSLAIGSSMGIFKMLPLYLVAEKGVDRNWANTLISLSRISTVFMVVVAGWVADRLGARKALVFVVFFSGAATALIGVASPVWLAPAIFFQSAMIVCFFPVGFAVLSRLSPPSLRNVTISVTILIAYLLGAGVVPAVIGLAGEYGSFSPAVSLLGLSMMFCVIFVRRLKPDA